jgi:hypothetical protein
LSGTESVINLQNASSSTRPVIRVFDAGTTPFGKDAIAGDYCFQLTSAGLIGKQAATAVSAAKVVVDFTNGEQIHRLGTDINVHRKLLGGTAATYALSDSGSTYVPYRIDGNELQLNTYSGGDVKFGGIIYPSVDNSKSCGLASNRWSVVYAGTGTINTSDEREKQDIEDLSDAELRVATSLKSLVKKFRFRDAVQAKGDDARIHVGVIAQEVIAAFQAEGLDPMHYGIVCYDQWDATDDEPAGDRYGIRYEELLAFIIAAL